MDKPTDLKISFQALVDSLPTFPPLSLRSLPPSDHPPDAENSAQRPDRQRSFLDSVPTSPRCPCTDGATDSERICLDEKDLRT